MATANGELKWITSNICMDEDQTFWFTDETSDLHGPYPTREIAEAWSWCYAHYLNTGESYHVVSVMFDKCPGCGNLKKTTQVECIQCLSR